MRLAGRLSGFEPLLDGPQPSVLPLHHSRRERQEAACQDQMLDDQRRKAPRISAKDTAPASRHSLSAGYRPAFLRASS